MRRTLILVATAAALCGAMPSAFAARTQLPLQRTNWVLTDRVSLGTPLADVAVDAVFDGNTVSGISGCNGYSRGYSIDGRRMTMGAMGPTTQMFCEGAAGKVEPAYLKRLGQVGRFRITGSNLTLSTRAGHRLLVFRASTGEAALAGGWNVTGIYTGDAISSPVAGSALTLEFAGDRASGNSGCNTFDGDYTLSRVDRIELGPFRSTLRACVDPAVNDQEQQYLRALELAVTYRVTGSQLTLFRPGGTIAATLQR